jgi:hypothetical protein
MKTGGCNEQGSKDLIFRALKEVCGTSGYDTPTNAPRTTVQQVLAKASGI